MIRPLAAILAAFLLVRPVLAEPVCGPLEMALEAFRLRHGEVPYVTMRDAAGNRLIVLANPDTRSWSLLVVPPTADAAACLVATGQGIVPASRVPGRTS